MQLIMTSAKTVAHVAQISPPQQAIQQKVANQQATQQ
jgi:hypothetical protein